MPIDSRVFRQAVGQFATGVTIVAMEVEGTLRAMTANSFTSVSLDPPLVLFCVGKHTRAGASIHDVRTFSINILREDQKALSSYFAGAWKAETPPAFRFVDSPVAPRLEGAAVALLCRVHAVHEGGDHWIVVGEVLAIEDAGLPARPLVFHGGRYVSLAIGDADPDAQLLVVAWADP